MIANNPLIVMEYSQETLGERTVMNYKLSSPNGMDYTHKGVLRRGDEDYNALLIYLNSRENIRFSLRTQGMEMPADKKDSLVELIDMHNAAVK